jgi:hypothetical protein
MKNSIGELGVMWFWQLSVFKLTWVYVVSCLLSGGKAATTGACCCGLANV